MLNSDFVGIGIKLAANINMQKSRDKCVKLMERNAEMSNGLINTHAKDISSKTGFLFKDGMVVQYV